MINGVLWSRGMLFLVLLCSAAPAYAELNWQRIVECSELPWLAGYSPVVLGDQLVLLGGIGYSSLDGREFSLAFDYPLIPGTRSVIFAYHASVVYDNKIWVLGGGRPDSVPEDRNVYWSSDGMNWSFPNNDDGYTAPWGPRGGPAGVVFAGAMWLLGGSYYPGTDKQSAQTVYYNDVWRSVDGIEWEQVVADAPWEGRAYHEVIVLGDQILLLGGQSATELMLRDVWSK